MSDRTGIEWTDATWNPITGCTEVSPGCDHCYAKTLAERFRGTPGHYYEHGFDVQLRPDKLEQPLRWRKPRKVFVNSMSDLFHQEIPDDYIAKVFAVMSLAPQHTFQVLTKRHARMRALLDHIGFQVRVSTLAYEMALGAVASIDAPRARAAREAQRLEDGSIPQRWPLPNVWLGVSVENQQWADIRIPALLAAPAAVRFLSCEPLLGPVDIINGLGDSWLTGIDWIIAGGESGRGARPMDLGWVRSLRDQCDVAGVPFFYKQQGSGDGGPKSRRELDGRTHDEYPQEVRP